MMDNKNRGFFENVMDLIFSPERLDESKEEISGDRKKNLEDRLLKLRTRHEKLARRNRTFLVFGIFFLIATPILYFSLKLDAIYLSAFLFYGFMFLLIPFTRPTREIEIQIRDIENELDLFSISQNPIEERAEKQFKLHQLELKKYYDQTLRQSAGIFYVGIFCILLGFVIIAVTLYFVFLSSTSKETETSEKIILASLGAIGAILSDFIAFIYIKMYSETIQSLTEFHNRLVVTHFLHFGNFLVGKITDKDLREKTLADIASSLAKQDLTLETKPNNQKT
ncbi:MAG: hypothetical protein WC568_05730 [Candidatus Methanoperedens sp.]